jgi:DNA-binding GntR family transcriptional regulator
VTGLDSGSGVPLRRQLADVLRTRIDTGWYRPGDQIPAETQLAEEAGVHRVTVRAALAILRGEGLVETRRSPGSTCQGTYVRAEPRTQFVTLPMGALVRAPLDSAVYRYAREPE